MNEPSIREQLLKMEKRSPEFEERFSKEIKKMMEKTLTRTERIAWTLSIFLGLFFVLQFSYVAVTAPAEFPLLGRLVFIFGAVCGGIWMALGVWTLTRKSFNWMRLENATQGLTFGFMLILMIGLMMLGGQMKNEVTAIHMILNGAIFFMIFGIPAIFTLRINRTESAIREQMLKLELKVSELADDLQKEK